MQKKEIKEGEPLRKEAMKMFDLANIFYKTMLQEAKARELKGLL